MVLHPDLAEALAAAEDALTAALGHEAKARPRGGGCRIQLDFDSPAEAVELAERLLAGGLGPPLESPPPRAISSAG